MIQCRFWLNDEEEICYYEHSRKMLCGKYTVTISVGAWRKNNVTSSVTNYCCQKVISKVTISLLEGVNSNE